MPNHQSICVQFFDGNISTAHAGVLSKNHLGQLVVRWQGQERYYDQQDYVYLPAVGNVGHAIEFCDGARAQLPYLPDWLTLPKQQRLLVNISLMEQSWRWVLVGLLVMVVFIVGMYRYGIPMVSDHIAQRLPADILMDIGNLAEEQVMKMTGDSTLPASHQARIIKLYDKLEGNPAAKVIIRAGKELDANAFALPNNTIVLTDELIKLSNDDNEILAVMAHEQGHLVHRHSLKQAIRGLGISVLIVMITGDTSDLITGLPTIFATLQYSQQFEMQADKFAIDELTRLNISPIYLANFFEKINDEHDGHSHWSLISTHPDTQERIKQVHQHLPKNQ